MKAFVERETVPAMTLEMDHGGVGAIEFRRLLSSIDFVAPIDFVDFTVVAPGSAIGVHEHVNNDEIYCIAKGMPMVWVEGEERRLHPGSISVVRSGQRHGLTNDTDGPVEIFVVQVRYLGLQHG